MDVSSEFDSDSFSNVYIDNADEDSENSYNTELFNDTIYLPKQNSIPHKTEALTHIVNINRSNTDTSISFIAPSSDTIVIIDSDSEEEISDTVVPKSPTEQHSGPWLNAFERKKLIAGQNDLRKDDSMIVDNRVSSDNHGKKVISPEADLGYCEGEDVDDNFSPDDCIHMPTKKLKEPSTSAATTATPVSRSPAAGRKSKQNRMYYCSDCRAVFSEQHEHERQDSEEKTQKLYTCDFCHEEFQSQLAYSRHGQSCARRCTCQFCGKVFNEITTLKQHLFIEHALPKDNASTSTRHLDASREIKENWQIFSDCSTLSNDLNDSLKTEQVEQEPLIDSTKFPCSVCTLVFSNANNLKKHTTSKHFSPKKTVRKKKGRTKCCKNRNKKKACNPQSPHGGKSKRVTEPGPSTNNQTIVSKQQQTSTCDFCQEHFSSVEKYSEHCKSCKIRCTCPFCGTVFQAMRELRKHMFTKHDLSDDENESTEESKGTDVRASEFQCSKCGAYLSSRINLNRHIRLRHSKPAKKHIPDSKADSKYHCSVCNISLHNALSFKKHQRKHPTKTKKLQEALISRKKRKQAKLPVKKYKCDECGVLLSNAYNLKRHKNIHVKLLRKSVSTCTQPKVQEKFTVTKMNAEKKKTGKFRCGICGDYFNHLFNLERHAMIHSEATPYQCQVCFTRFSKIQHLQCHFEKFHIMDS